ncbi:hypothetical protein [uncultured Methanobrevibacter sp.]|uniref:hypothetical protein n=1 Tax=uncultured Methanobrevibacter sp. TaxID=253161 RepID=UPI0026252A55|nr:hypothetical protein [uncultured Methanobrevibacter sp.]
MKARILSLEQTEAAGLFTIIFEGQNQSEFVKFITKFKDDAVRKNDLRVILNQIDAMLLNGVAERRFRPEGKMNDGVCALPVYKSGLRLYCLRLSDSVLIVGNGGVKGSKTYEDDEDLNGYVISLQKLDALLKSDIKNGIVRIEKTEIIGIEDKEYDL